MALQRGASFLLLFLFGNEEMKVSRRGHQGSQVAFVVKNLPANAGDARDDPWVGKIPWRTWQPTPVFLPGEFHRQEPGGLQSIGLQRVGHD